MGTTTTYIDRPSLLAVIVTSILIVIIVTIGVFVHVFADELTARITLISLIVFLSVLGISALTYLEIRKRKAQQLDKNAMKNGYLYNNLQPSAPKDPNWEYSHRTTMPA